MKNNIKKALVKIQEGLLYFQHFMQIFGFCPKSGIITTLKPAGALAKPDQTGSSLEAV